MTIRVVVADDQDLVRTGLTMILNAQPDIEVVGESRPHRRDQCLHLGVGQDLRQAGLLHVDDLAPDRQDRLGRPVAGHLGRSTGGITLDDVQLGLRGVA